MKKHLEENIQAEIQRRVFEEEEKKQQRQNQLANQEALSEVSGLSSLEVERIAADVRREMLQKQTFRKKFLLGFMLVDLIVFIFFIGMVMFQYNHIVSLNEAVQTKWGQVENVYQRRYDLLPNLVNIVKAHAQHEKELVQMLTDAHAKAGGVLKISSDSLQQPEALQQFQSAQNELSAILRRMMGIVEANPNIAADQNFLALQAQLEGAENRITVERKRFNEAVQRYNSYIKRFPQNIFSGLFGFSQKAYFTAEQGAQNAPKITF